MFRKRCDYEEFFQNTIPQLINSSATAAFDIADEDLITVAGRSGMAKKLYRYRLALLALAVVSFSENSRPLAPLEDICERLFNDECEAFGQEQDGFYFSSGDITDMPKLLMEYLLAFSQGYVSAKGSPQDKRLNAVEYVLNSFAESNYSKQQLVKAHRSHYDQLIQWREALPQGQAITVATWQFEQHLAEMSKGLVYQLTMPA